MGGESVGEAVDKALELTDDAGMGSESGTAIEVQTVALFGATALSLIHVCGELVFFVGNEAGELLVFRAPHMTLLPHPAGMRRPLNGKVEEQRVVLAHEEQPPRLECLPTKVAVAVAEAGEIREVEVHPRVFLGEIQTVDGHTAEISLPVAFEAITRQWVLWGAFPEVRVDGSALPNRVVTSGGG